MASAAASTATKAAAAPVVASRQPSREEALGPAPACTDTRKQCTDVATFCSLQVSFAITTAATEGASAGAEGSASPHKRQRTDGGTTEAATAALAKQLFVEAGSPISVAKAVKNKVGWAATASQRTASKAACAF